MITAKFGPMVNYALSNDVSVSCIEGTDVECVVEEMGFSSIAEFIEFYHEHFNDECDFEYFNDYMNEAFQFETTIDGRDFASWYWNDSIYEDVLEALSEIYDEEYGDNDEIEEDTVNDAFAEALVEEINENYSEEIMQ